MSIRSTTDPRGLLGAPVSSSIVGGAGAFERDAATSATLQKLGCFTPWGHHSGVRTRQQASGALSDPPLIHRPSRRCVDAGAVVRAYARARAPRGFIVLGERFSLGWMLLGMALALSMALATCAEERDAQHRRQALEREVDAAAEVAVDAVSEEAQCEAVLSVCTRAIGRGESCSCWLDDDGAGGTWR